MRQEDADDDYDDGLDVGHQTDTDSEFRAESIRALRRVDRIFAASGRGSRAEHQSASEWGKEGEDVATGGGESLQVNSSGGFGGQPTA